MRIVRAGCPILLYSRAEARYDVVVGRGSARTEEEPVTQKLVHTHNYSFAYLAELGLHSCGARAEIFEVPGGYVFTVTTDEKVPPVEGPFQNSGGSPFSTLEDAMVMACQYHSYPEVLDYKP